MLPLAACERGREVARGAIPEDCGLPSPEPGTDAARVPPEFLLEGDAEVRRVHSEGKLLVVALNLPMPVAEAYERYKMALDRPEYEVITEDFEGFEFEIYLQQVEDDRLVAVQVRRPLCEEASAGYVTIDRGRARQTDR